MKSWSQRTYDLRIFDPKNLHTDIKSVANTISSISIHTDDGRFFYLIDVTFFSMNSGVLDTGSLRDACTFPATWLSWSTRFLFYHGN